MAEETGLIHGIGEWVLEEAMRQLALWRKLPGGNGLSVNINCSRKQLVDGRYAGRITDIIAAAGMPHESLNLEVTESTVMEDPDHTRALLKDLRAKGIGIHMDDFGTGYSSLNCLHGLPLTVLKIDRSFIRNVSMRRDYAAVVNAIVSLAHNLHMKVIGEGVESAEHAAVLCALECDFAQGYFFSPAVPAAEAQAFLTRPIATPGAGQIS
jgi:EAL domain-containing protein (putative c-di-GMP-specific phosphodiesterase class I)